jgi:4-hydroxy-tetrahydrodipicolinate synthase
MPIPSFVRGSIAPTFTAFQDDGTLDETGQRNLLDYMLAAGGVNAFFLRSGMGQMYAFTMDEARTLARVATAHLAGKAPLLFGCSGAWDRNYDRRPDPATFLQESIALGQYLAELGADGVVYTVPEAIAPQAGETTADVTLRYFEAVCAAVPVPVFLYQPPKTRPEYLLSPETMGRLADIPNLVGGKLSQSDGEYLFRMCRATAGKDYGFIVGCETVFYAGLLAGGCAAIGQGTSLNPKVINAVQDCWEARDIPGLIAAQEAVNRLCDGCPNPVAFLKRYATEKGHPVGEYFRSAGDNPYMTDPKPLSPEAYTAFKTLFETECAPYAG